MVIDIRAGGAEVVDRQAADEVHLEVAVGNMDAQW